MKASVLLFLWLSFLFHTSSCSRVVVVNNAATANSSGSRTTGDQNAGNISNQSPQTLERSPSLNQKDVVLFDGKNYIKKSGWKTPSRKDAYIDETYDRSNTRGLTKNGRSTKTNTILYIFKTQWLYSQDFYYEGRSLDYMQGNLEAGYFLEMSANGKVFMYTISGRKRVSTPPSNSEPHDDPFVYDIQDNDGDGLFETLLGGSAYDDIIVPDWVLK